MNEKEVQEQFGTVFKHYPNDIAAALVRAEAWWRINRVNETFYIKSRNLEAPLTDSEKNRIRIYLGLRGFPMEIVFEN